MATTLKALGLTRLFGPNKAVNNVSFELSKGEVLGFLGPNGAGKSTTMRMLTGNLAPTEGQVEICGVNIIEEPKLAKANIGYLPEMRPLYKEFRVNEFLTIAAKLHNISAKKINSSIDIAMENCGLTHMSNRLIENLSNGYQQRVGIAQAIIHNPEILILDEPTVGLDPIQIREIRKLIKEIGKEHSVILSTHILPEVEIVCDRVQIIDKGNMVFHGSIDDLKQQRRGNKLLVGFKKTPTLKKLQSLFDIVKIEKQEDLLHVIQFKNLDFDMEKFIQVCVKEKLGLFQVSPHITSLEDTFVQLTNK